MEGSSSSRDLGDARATAEAKSDDRARFWRRQFQSLLTGPQRAFDLVFGIIAPLLCLLFDPIVFTSPAVFGSGIFGSHRPFAYTEIAIGMVALAYHLISGRTSAVLSAILLAGALFSFALGLLLLPLSVVGLLWGVGIFGFIPFATCFVFARNADRNWHAANRKSGTLATVALLATAGLPVVFQMAVTGITDRAIVAIQRGTQTECDRAVRDLQKLALIIDNNRLLKIYQQTPDKKERARLSVAFETLTGKTADQRLAEIRD